MSFELVNRAANSPAFDPTPPPETLANAHVPFRRLTGDDVEGGLAQRLASYDRVALVGPVGAGKSSLARYTLREPAAAALAPIWINVATEDHAQIATVRGFLEILTGQLLSRANSARRATPEQRRAVLRGAQPAQPLGGQATRLHAQLGGSPWLLNGAIAAEISRTFDYGAATRATQDMRDAVVEALAIIADAELTPVLVADDTDRLLMVGADEQLSERLFRGFFGEVLREIADQFQCGLLVAAHTRYTERTDYRELTEGRLRALELPELDRPEHFGDLIDTRIAFLDEQASWRDLVQAPVLDRLAELHHHHHARSVRRTLTCLREALAFATDADVELVAVAHLDGTVSA